MEATMFTGWIYDTLKPLADELKVANPQQLKAISCAKKKSDRRKKATWPRGGTSFPLDLYLS